MILAQIQHTSELDLLQSFAQSGPMAKIVLGTLLVMSIVSWAIMIGKIRQFRRAAQQSRKFLDLFRRSKRFSEVSSGTERLRSSPLVGLFQAGYMEIDTQIKARHSEADEAGNYRVKSLDGVHRSLRRAAGVEMLVLSKGLGFLATAAAASPFIGLFGTVWGIMMAFNDIGTTGSTSLVAVAPGIAEALINTAAGLLVAIPALMGYNYFAYQLRGFRTEIDDFVLEFENLAERNFT